MNEHHATHVDADGITPEGRARLEKYGSTLDAHNVKHLCERIADYPEVLAAAAGALGTQATAPIPALTHEESLSLAERIRVAFDAQPDQRVIQDTWLHAAAAAEQWYAERASATRLDGGAA